MWGREKLSFQVVLKCSAAMTHDLRRSKKKKNLELAPEVDLGPTVYFEEK